MFFLTLLNAFAQNFFKIIYFFINYANEKEGTLKKRM